VRAGWEYMSQRFQVRGWRFVDLADLDDLPCCSLTLVRGHVEVEMEVEVEVEVEVGEYAS
jgi:hypothetical protein